MIDAITADANVAQFLLERGRDDAPALWHGRTTVSYAELRAAVWACAERIEQADGEAGERVGIFAENCPFFVAAYLGAIYAGRCAVPFQTDCSEPTFERIVRSTGMRRIFASRQFRPRLAPLAARLDVELLVEPSPNAPLAAAPRPATSVDPGAALAALVWTSGSTGVPKGVMVTHRNIVCNTADILSYLPLTADDRAMVVLPFYYCYGLSLLHTHLRAGAALALNNQFLFPVKVLDEMLQRGCTGLAGVPSTYQILLRKTDFARRGFPALRWLQQAGGALPAPLIQEIRRALPAVRFYVMYGQTEATARLSYLPPERLDDKLGSIGWGLPHTRLEVLRDDGQAVRPGSNETGEIVASGENIALGYWDDADETCRYFRDGRLYTGDIARVDDEGCIYIMSRARDFIKAMGNRVSPKEIEDVLAELPAVVEAAVIGSPHELFGEAIVAFLVTSGPGGLSVDDVRTHCQRRLPSRKVPAAFRFLPALPKTANGKVSKEALSELLRGEAVPAAARDGVGPAAL